MSSRRTIILVGAIAVGIFAGIALLNYVRGVEDEIAAEKQSVPVYVASQDIAEGTSAAEAQSMFTVAQIPLELRPNTYLPIDGEEAITGLVAAGIIPKNQIILASGQWVNADVVQRSFVDQIPTGQVAVTMQIAQVNAVGGYLQPGDEVNMMVRHGEVGCGVGDADDADDADDAADVGDADDADDAADDADDADDDDSTEPESGGLGDLLAEVDEAAYCTFSAPARYVFQRIEILAIGARQTLAPGETQTGVITPQDGAITFAVPSEAAQLLASINPEDVYLTLLPEDYQAEPLPALTFDVLVGPTPAEIPSCLTPYGPDGFIEGDQAADADSDGDDAWAGNYRCDDLWNENAGGG